ncbi:hypothetical protein CTZ28_39540 [Streptomyces shenzhenensis]|uniref:Uncharacterized protein n=1 Tax=Streptomyces shenzhenensis TaxID=943815 RepID=A0A3M0HWT3_9ACTN|nr:hypothetical protein CTZ28_39540 [Streptomyces shenzhenensis]
MVYAQPSGGRLASAYRRRQPQRGAIRTFVRCDGRNLGLLPRRLSDRGHTGFRPAALGQQPVHLLPRSPQGTGDTLVQVAWRGRPRTLFFQDGPYLILDKHADATVLATHPPGTPATLTTRFGAGRVVVVGPTRRPQTTGARATVLPVHHTLDLARNLVEALRRQP